MHSPGYYPLSDVQLDCNSVRVAPNTNANGVVTSPGGARSVRVTNVTLRPASPPSVDPIVFALDGLSEATVCAGSLYLSDPPFWCTSGDVKATYICPSSVDSTSCYTQLPAGAELLDWRAEYSVSWVGCGAKCLTAVAHAKPGWFDDVLALAVCAALLCIAIAAPHVVELSKQPSSTRSNNLLVNWAFATSTLAVMHERLPMQPLWSHGLLAATAASTLYGALFHAPARRPIHMYESLTMSLIAATLPSRSLGASAVRVVRFVIGLGLCVTSGYWPSTQSVFAGLWAAAATIYPVVVTASNTDNASRDLFVTLTIAVSAAIAGWASAPVKR